MTMCNVGATDRTLRIVGGIGLLVLGYFSQILGITQIWQWTLYTLGGVSLVTVGSPPGTTLSPALSKLGVIATGALADALGVDGNPLEDMGLMQDQGAHLSAIMKDGAWVKNTLGG